MIFAFVAIIFVWLSPVPFKSLTHINLHVWLKDCLVFPYSPSLLTVSYVNCSVATFQGVSYARVYFSPSVGGISIYISLLLATLRGKVQLVWCIVPLCQIENSSFYVHTDAGNMEWNKVMFDALILFLMKELPASLHSSFHFLPFALPWNWWLGIWGSWIAFSVYTACISW